jgi:hypothetical protein
MEKAEEGGGWGGLLGGVWDAMLAALGGAVTEDGGSLGKLAQEMYIVCV